MECHCAVATLATYSCQLAHHPCNVSYCQVGYSIAIDLHSISTGHLSLGCTLNSISIAARIDDGDEDYGQINFNL